MSCSTILESDEATGRVVSMWAECGIQFRANLITRVGGSIPLHVHDYDHKALIRGGAFDVREIGPDGRELHYRVVAGELITIGKGQRHEFTCTELQSDGPAEVLCFWGG